jgi:glycosyltransferase involved in cell wall biosynthesis
MLGHRAFAELMPRIAGRIPGLVSHHVDLSRDLTIGDRVLRRILGVPLAPPFAAAANLDLRRWRQEMNAGLLAARRVAAIERDSWPLEFDLLHFHTQATAYASLARMKRIPSIVSLDCTQRLASLEAGSRLGRASYRASIARDGRVFRAAAAIVATSQWAARDLAAAYPDCAHRLSVLPFPVDVEMFDPGWIEERAGRARDLHYRPRVLFVGGDFPRKGGPALLDAWRAGGFSDRATLDVVTDWAVSEAALPPGVVLERGVAPHSDRWRALWRRADIFAMPARHEAFGIVYEEAAASGIPAIGSRINAVPEIVEDGVTGLLVAPDSRDELVRALDTLIASPMLRERMGLAARRRVVQRAAVPVYAAKLGALIERVVTNDVRQPA